MVKLTIDGKVVEVKEGSTILEAAYSIGVAIPSLCYLKEINEIGACRVCVVEIEGIDLLVSSCNTKAEEGMVVFTNSPRVREARRTNVELLLSQHDSRCTSCVRSGNCTLQRVANDLGIINMPYKILPPPDRWTKEFPLYRSASKCIKCMRCVQVCDKIQGINIWDVEGTGSRTTINVSFNRDIKKSDCTLCGQCITHCPVGALRERDDTQRVLEALANPGITTVVQIAPAVRAAWGEALGLAEKSATVGRMVASLKRMGFNYVFDTNFAADLTIMEEGSEFLERLPEVKKSGKPMFTSCCPAWIRFVKSRYPQFVENLSTAKSPQQMFGAVAKSYFAEKIGVSPEKIFCVSIMPCVAKKSECELPTMQDTDYGHDVDVSLTTREFVRMIQADHIMPAMLENEEFDSPLGTASGAGVIFGVTGGVMEAALRSAYFLVKGENPNVDAFSNVRGLNGWKEAEFELNGTTLHVAIVSGLSNAARLLNAIQKGTHQYDFVEVMSCPGGCVGGGGQPIHDGFELTKERGDILYRLDTESKLRFSHENTEVNQLYKEFLGKPLGEKSHHLLHTDHTKWSMV